MKIISKIRKILGEPSRRPKNKAADNPAAPGQRPYLTRTVRRKIGENVVLRDGLAVLNPAKAGFGITGQRGFSLVELLIAIALIAIMTAIAAPMLNRQLPKWHQKGMARDVLSKLNMARLKAIQDNKKYGIEFTLSDIDSYNLVEYDDGSSSWVDAGVTGTGTSDVNIIPESCVESGGVYRVSFSGDGTATAGTCSSEEAISVKILTIATIDGEYFNDIEINTNTGYIKID